MFILIKMLSDWRFPVCVDHTSNNQHAGEGLGTTHALNNFFCTSDGVQTFSLSYGTNSVLVRKTIHTFSHLSTCNYVCYSEHINADRHSSTVCGKAPIYRSAANMNRLKMACSLLNIIECCSFKHLLQFHRSQVLNMAHMCFCGPREK